MTTTSRPVHRAWALLAALCLAGVAAVALGAPASAARTVDVVLSDREPAVVALQPGDSVRFVNGESSPLALHRVTSTERDGSTAWTYDSGNLTAGQAGPLATFPSAGTYVFLDRRGGPGPLGQDLVGRIGVTAPAPAAAPPAAPAQQVAPPPATTPAAPRPAPRPAAPAPVRSVPTSAPDLVGATEPDVPLAADPVVPPAVSDLLRDAGIAPVSAAPPLPPVQALQGPLPGEGTLRALGLPASLAALLAAGVASLIVRVLLAEPAADRARGFTTVQVSPAG